MTENKSVDFVIDLDKPQEEVLKDIAELVSNNSTDLKGGQEVALNFLVKKKGEKEQKLVYNLNREKLDEGEKEFVFPKVIGEVLKKEFNPKIAKNEKLMNHIMNELKTDPYWSNRVVKLIQSLKEEK